MIHMLLLKSTEAPGKIYRPSTHLTNVQDVFDYDILIAANLTHTCE